jgi:hypothetical protein
MLQITRPDLIFEKQKLFRTQRDVENKDKRGIQIKDGKEVIVLYSSPDNEALAGEERTQLFKIVNACKLKEEDVVLVNAAFAKNFSINWLKSNFWLKTVIVFGDIALSKNLVIRKHVAYNIDGVNIVKSESLTKLLTSAADKKALWEELRKVFGV